MIEFTHRPSILIVADSDAAAARARKTAEIAGCRVADSVPVEGAVERLARQVALDAAFVEVEGETSESLERLVEAINEAARAGGHASVVSTGFGLIDMVAARAAHPRVVQLCEATEAERVDTLTSVSSPAKHRLHDIGREDEPPKLRQLSEEVGRIASILAALSEEQAGEELPAPSEADGKQSRITAGMVRAIIRARRLREQFFGKELFADPAWDMLLDLFAARLEKRRVAVSSLCIAAAVPPTTALRWIKTLSDVGVVVRTADPQDGRRVYIELAPDTATAMEAYLRKAQRISPLGF